MRKVLVSSLFMFVFVNLYSSDTIKGSMFYHTVFLGERGFVSVKNETGYIGISSGKVEVVRYKNGSVYVKEVFSIDVELVNEENHIAYVCSDALGKKAYFHMWVSPITQEGLGYTIKRPFYHETTLFFLDDLHRVDFNYKTGAINGGERLHKPGRAGRYLRGNERIVRTSLPRHYKE